MVRWEAAVARCRGLASRLVDPAALAEMARAPSLAALAALLERAGLVLTAGESATPAALERALRRAAGRELASLGRWLLLGLPAAAASLFVEDEEVRSLRALVRGAVAGVPAETRLAGLVPTPGLPTRALELLAAEPRAAAIVATLGAWRHPYGAALASVVDPAAEPDALRLELALLRTFAARLVAGAREGDRELRRWAAERIDGLNLASALVLAREGTDAALDEVFLDGGETLARERFARIVHAGDGAAGVAAKGVADRDLAREVGAHGGDPAVLADRLLAHRIRVARRRSRVAPLGFESVLLFVLSLRAQVRNLSGVVWGVALGMPPELRLARLVEA